MKKVVKAKKKVFRAPKEERGFSKVILIVAGLVVLLGAGGLYVLSQQTGVSIPGLAAPLNPKCKYNDPDLCKFINNWREIKDYTATSVSSYDGKKIESVMELNAAGDTHMVSLEDGKEGYNVISIGDSTYTKDYTDNKWLKVTTKPVEVADDTVQEVDKKDEFDYGDEEDKTTYKAMGKEACGDLTCFKYEVVYQEGSDTTEYILFDDREYRLRKTISKSADGATSETSFAYSTVNISVPSPVKEMPAGGVESSVPGGYTEADVQKMMQQAQQESAGSTEYDAPVMDESYSDN